MPDRYVKQVLNGDKEAFRHIIQSCKDGAYNLSFSILKEEHASKDVVQKAFLKAYEQLASFRGESAFKTWFHRIVVNEALQMARSRKTSRWEDEQFSGELAPVAADAHEQAGRDHVQYCIEAALGRMKRDESLSLKLFYLEEHTIAEVAAITGWSSSKTKVTLHRARKSMKELLQQMDHLNFEMEDI
jgi:RNA polymerase sigma factor (sigma-70 family)